MIIEKKNPYEPLQFSYDPAMDVITIKGLRFSGDVFRFWGDVFRFWTMPDDRFYRFRRMGDQLKVDVVEPCPTCRGQIMP